MEYIYLSRRNLKALISKLDRKANGDKTACSIIKQDTEHKTYPQSIDCVCITAVEDEEYYTDRDAGPVHYLDV